MVGRKEEEGEGLAEQKPHKEISSQHLVGAVPREDLQNVAREIVKVAGLSRDQEDEALLEGSKLKVEAAKTQVLISSGSLVGIAAVVRVLSTGKHMFFLAWAVLLIGLSVLGGFFCMDDIARSVTARRRPPPEVSWFGPLLLAFGLLMFGLYCYYNVPWELAEGVLAWTKARNVMRMLVGGVGLSVVALTAFVFVRWLTARTGASSRP